MKKLVVAFALLVAVGAGIALERFWLSPVPDLGSGGAKEEREILYWQAPMDPNYRRDKPGKSPMGMDLVPVYADDVQEDPGVVRIQPRVVANLGVRTGEVVAGPLPRRIETVGYVSFDEETVEQITTRAEGWIERLAVKAAGERVKRGQLLFELYSPTLVNAQQEYLAALASGNAVLLKASRDRLAALGVTPSQIDVLDKNRKVSRRVQVFAESDGFVATLGVREGVYVTPSTMVMSLSDLDTVWVMAEVFERQSAWVREGQTAEVRLDYLPDRHWGGEVDYVYPELDAKTRTLQVRLRFDNIDEVLRPNMFARVTILGQDTGSVTHIPREALIRGGAADRVVLALEDGRYRSVAVDAGIESGDRIEIRAGLVPGQRVVVSGQFLIDSESNIEAELRRIEGRPEEGAAP